MKKAAFVLVFQLYLSASLVLQDTEEKPKIEEEHEEKDKLAEKEAISTEEEAESTEEEAEPTEDEAEPTEDEAEPTEEDEEDMLLPEEMLEGMYVDFNHPSGERHVYLDEDSSVTLTVAGNDEGEDDEWELKGTFDKAAKTVKVDFSSKGGQQLEGVVKPDGIHWPDGNVWKKFEDGDDSMEGTYLETHDGGDAKREVYLDEEHRDVVTITGTDKHHTGIFAMFEEGEWELKGAYNGHEILIDLSSKGGPKDAVGTVEEDGIYWSDGKVWRKAEEDEQKGQDIVDM